MENASKALLIAGGILLALLTLSLITVLISNINSFQTAKDETEALKQLAKFNTQYEVFNKEKLHGTEVITAVNKVANNNFKVQDDSGNPWFIDVEIITNGETFKTEILKEKISDRDAEPVSASSGELPESEKISTVEIDASGINLIEKGSELRMNSGMIEFFSQNSKDSQQKNSEYKFYIYSALTTFKTRIFSGEVKYNEEGRINKIIFTLQPQ